MRSSVLLIGSLSLSNDIIGCLKIDDTVEHHSDKIHDKLYLHTLNYYYCHHSHQIGLMFSCHHLNRMVISFW